MSADEVRDLRRLLDDVKIRIQRTLREALRPPGAPPANVDWQKELREVLKLLNDRTDVRIPVRGNRRRDANKMERFANRKR